MASAIALFAGKKRDWDMSATNEFHLAFDINAKVLGDVLIALQPFKISNLDLQPIVQRNRVGKAGGMTASQTVVAFVNDSPKPVAPKEIAQALASGGFNKSGVSTHIAAAVKQKLIRKVSNGLYGKPSAERASAK